MRMSKTRLMRQIQTLAFAAHEAALYLDGHPTDRKALAYFNMQNEKLREATAEYENNFGPLTANGFNGDDRWTWTDGPWPWKYEANADVQ